MSDLLEYMKNRRSSLSMTLEDPAPNDRQIQDIVEIATRVPDHGKLTPWRIEQWQPKYRKQLHKALSGLINPENQDAGKLQSGLDKILHGPLLLAVISTATEHPKIPVREQLLSAGAVCMNTIIAANALGFEAQWLTAWYVYEPSCREILALKDGEEIAGLIHIGTSSVAKNERDRPAISDVFSVKEA